ncbi:MAG: hypothetical protein VX519_03780 [Myxococcota bacterium]|nr:hypothetical protein [Myxococcota bacterium]
MILLAIWLGCVGGNDDAEEKSAVQVVSSSAVATTWMVEVAAPGILAPLVRHEGWQAYHGRDYSTAMARFGDPGVPTARMHTELSALYRLTALAQARAIVLTWGEDQRREGDPPEVDYLLGVAHVLLGDADAAGKHLGKSGGSTLSALSRADIAWKERLDAGGGLLSLSEHADLFPLSVPQVGGMPDAVEAPHYVIPTGDTALKAGDPTQLLQLAAWHEAAAIMAGGETLTAALLDPWRLPGEARGVDPIELPLEARFLSIWSSSEDLNVVRSLDAGVSGLEEVQTLLETKRGASIYAGVLSKCFVEPSLDVECVFRRAADLPDQLVSAMDEAAGMAKVDHRDFAAYSRLGVLNMGIRIAEALDDARTAGLLRINALDVATGVASEPLFLVDMAAWDVGNRNPHRGKELFHGQSNRAPGMDGARYALDSLYLRVSRDAGVGIPMH